jgi:hypothetical protein
MGTARGARVLIKRRWFAIRPTVYRGDELKADVQRRP